MTKPQAEPGSAGAAIRLARRARVRWIRRRVVAGALALLVATWLLIALTMLTGHAPAVSLKTSRPASRSARATTSTPISSTASSLTTAQS